MAVAGGWLWFAGRESSPKVIEVVAAALAMSALGIYLVRRGKWLVHGQQAIQDKLSEDPRPLVLYRRAR